VVYPWCIIALYPASVVGVRGRRRYRREAATPVEFLDSWRSGRRESSSHHGDVKVVFPPPPRPLLLHPPPLPLPSIRAGLDYHARHGHETQVRECRAKMPLTVALPLSLSFFLALDRTRARESRVLCRLSLSLSLGAVQRAAVVYARCSRGLERRQCWSSTRKFQRRIFPASRVSTSRTGSAECRR